MLLINIRTTYKTHVKRTTEETMRSDIKSDQSSESIMDKQRRCNVLCNAIYVQPCMITIPISHQLSVTRCNSRIPHLNVMQSTTVSQVL